MPSLRERLVVEARVRVGEPFSQHYLPTDPCSYNNDEPVFTDPRCNERGLGQDGYDCTGLFLVCLAVMFGREPTDTPTLRRHIEQFEDAGRARRRKPGDIAFYRDGLGDMRHAGIVADNDRLVHATNRFSNGIGPRVKAEPLIRYDKADVRYASPEEVVRLLGFAATEL